MWAALAALLGAVGLMLAGCASTAGGSGSNQAGAAGGEAAASSSDSAKAPGTTADSEGAAENKDEDGSAIIVLWSWSENTAKMAERVSELSGAQIYRIEAAEPYPEDYDETLDRSKKEKDEGVYPKIANPIENWDRYSTVYLGYPIWWYEMPMIVQGFVKDHDWAGKTVIPFNSHEGSGDAGTYEDLREMTGTTVLDGLAIRGGEVASSLDEVDEWYAKLER